MAVDRISELPDPILHLILLGLHSTEEAVRTSVLSPRWRYLWTSIPSLDIDISCSLKHETFPKRNQFKEFVYWVLANRRLHLDSFTLNCGDERLYSIDISTIQRWIRIAVMRNVKQLVLSPCLVNHDSIQGFLKHQNMKKSNQSKAPITDHNNADRISSMPDRILLMILSRLPSTKQVIRTSVLSKRWKYLWTSIPSLDIYSNGVKNNFIDFVYWVLANRIIDLDSFRLKVPGSIKMPTLGRWIHLAVMRKIKQFELTFIFPDKGVVVLPHCLENCDSLEVIKLDFGGNSLSLSSFTGCRTLKVLKLEDISLLDHELVQKFLVNCPLLEELSLIRCCVHNLDFHSISCPNLKTLRIKKLEFFIWEYYFDQPGKYRKIDLSKGLMVLCPKLVYLEYKGYRANNLLFDVKSLKKAVIKLYRKQEDEIAICKLCAQVSHVEYLSVSYSFVKSISFRCKRFNFLEEGLPESFPNLKTLELAIDCCNMQVPISILRCSRNIESLHLTFYKDIAPEEYEAFVEKFNEVEAKRIFRHLKKVKFHDFSGEKESLAIARFLLEHGNVLEEMVFNWTDIAKYSKQSREEVMNEVSKFYKASLSVKVITLFTSFWLNCKYV